MLQGRLHRAEGQAVAGDDLQDHVLDGVGGVGVHTAAQAPDDGLLGRGV
jgi:hypothetical protein